MPPARSTRCRPSMHRLTVSCSLVSSTNAVCVHGLPPGFEHEHTVLGGRSATSREQRTEPGAQLGDHGLGRVGQCASTPRWAAAARCARFRSPALPRGRDGAIGPPLGRDASGRSWMSTIRFVGVRAVEVFRSEILADFRRLDFRWLRWVSFGLGGWFLMFGLRLGCGSGRLVTFGCSLFLTGPNG
jgi:hypothetical protein